MHVEYKMPVAELERLERLEKDARSAKLIRIVILATNGYTAPAISRSVERQRHHRIRLGIGKCILEGCQFHCSGSSAEFRKSLAGPLLLESLQDSSRF